MFPSIPGNFRGSRRSRYLARGSPFRWMPEMRNGIERAWWTDVAPDEEEAELAWLREAIYGVCGITCPRAGSCGGA